MVAFSEVVTGYPSGGMPMLALNDGGAATYTGGSGSNSLIFSLRLRLAKNTSDLTVTAFNLNGATVRDAQGNDANLAGFLTNPSRTINHRHGCEAYRSSATEVTDDVLPCNGPSWLEWQKHTELHDPDRSR